MHSIDNQTVPNVVFHTRSKNAAGEYEWKDVSTADIFAGKKIVVFSLPGAFTPTCSSLHFPGYENNYDKLKALGIDEVYCLSVNDTFVMNSWAKDQNVVNVKVIPDGSGEFSKGLGMLVKKHNLGFGDRSWRYSMVVDNGVVTKSFVEPGFSDDCPTDPFEVSDVYKMLEYLEGAK
jgi:thioredoxin-dependent peroxiredoxin